jgi:hypothetical protein
VCDGEHVTEPLLALAQLTRREHSGIAPAVRVDAELVDASIPRPANFRGDTSSIKAGSHHPHHLRCVRRIA